MKKLIVTYRDNELFSSIVPKLLALIPRGVEVEKLIFPQGTPVAEMTEPIKALLKGVTGPTIYLSDQTCSTNYSDLYYAVEAEFKAARSKGFRSAHPLDFLMSLVVNKMFDTKTFAETFKKLYEAMAKGISQVIIVQELLNEHRYGYSDVETFGETTYTMCNGIKRFVNEVDPEVTVIIVGNVAIAKKIGGDSASTMIIANRHTEAMEDHKWPYQAKLFLLPFESTMGNFSTEDNPFGKELDVQDMYNCLIKNIISFD